MNVSANSRELVESDDDLLDAELRKSISSTIYATLCQVDIYTISTHYLHTIYTLSTHCVRGTATTTHPSGQGGTGTETRRRNKDIIIMASPSVPWSQWIRASVWVKKD